MREAAPSAEPSPRTVRKISVISDEPTEVRRLKVHEAAPPETEAIEEAPSSRRLTVGPEIPPSPEHIDSEPLARSRQIYAEAERRYAEAVSKCPGQKNLIEEAVTRHKLTAQDREWISGAGSLAEDAHARRDALIQELVANGVGEFLAFLAYAKEIARLEYESEKQQRKMGVYEKGSDILKDFEVKFGKDRANWTTDEVGEAHAELEGQVGPAVLEFLRAESERLNDERKDRELPPQPLPESTGSIEIPRPERTADSASDILTDCGFAPAELESVLRSRVVDLLGQSYRTQGGFPPAYRRLAAKLRERGASHESLTIRDYLEGRLPEPAEIRSSPEVPPPPIAVETPPTLETRPMPETRIEPPFSEVLINKDSLPFAIERQLAAHLNGKFVVLSPIAQAEAAAFLRAKLEADPSVLGTDLARLSPGERINFAPLFDDRELIAETLGFPEEVEVLKSLHFADNEIFDPAYIGVIREMTVGDYAELFPDTTPANWYRIYGLRKNFRHGDRSVSAFVDEGHLALAEAILRVSRSADIRQLRLKEFISRFGPEILA